MPELGPTIRVDGNTIRGLPFDFSSEHTITSFFGAHEQFRKDMGLGPHKGVDFGDAPDGTPLYALTNGVVERSTQVEHTGVGYYIRVKTPDNYIWKYFHLNGPPVLKKGDKVRRGQLVGYVGSTGKATGPHLHLGLEKNAANLDPLPFLTEVATETWGTARAAWEAVMASKGLGNRTLEVQYTEHGAQGVIKFPWEPGVTV